MQGNPNRFKVYSYGNSCSGYRVYDSKHQRNAEYFLTSSRTPEEARREAEAWAAEHNATTEGEGSQC